MSLSLTSRKLQGVRESRTGRKSRGKQLGRRAGDHLDKAACPEHTNGCDEQSSAGSAALLQLHFTAPSRPCHPPLVERVAVRLPQQVARGLDEGGVAPGRLGAARDEAAVPQTVGWISCGWWGMRAGW